ncbi:unnamed protein product [Durusdinium trenchii]|uniref:Uncharacterized protein n=1 Tax=Durusdinium trenchii TaxID=1381693 RepID=A0ABP0QIE1_9DINO
MAQASTAVAPDDVLVEENKKEDEAPPATPEEAQAEENGEEQVVSIPRKTFFVDEEELEETERKTLLQRINDWASSGVVYLPKSVDIANKRVNIVYCFLEIVVLALTIWYFVQRPEQYSVSLTPDAQVTFCGSRCEPLPSRMDAMTDQDSSSYCGSLTYTNGADSYGPFECLRRCGHPNSTTHCLQPSELLRISGEEAFVPTSYRLTDTLQAVNGSCAMGYTLQSSVCVWQQDYFVPAIEKLAVSFNHQFVVYPVYNSLSFMERAPPLKAHSGAYKSQGWDVGLLSVLFSPSGAEVKRFQPGQGVTLTLEEILQAAYVEGADSIGLDSVYSRADAAVSSLPARLTGLAVTIDIWTTSSQTCEIHHTIQTEKPKEVQVEWSGPIACMSVHVDQRWAKQQEEQTLGALGMRVVNMNGVHVKFRQMGSFYFLEEQALLRNITVVLLWVQFPVLICYWFCMLFLGMLSGIYSAVLHQEVNVAEGLKGFSARLLTYSSAFMNLRGKSDNLKSDGVSKKCVSERLSKICENLEVEDTVLEQLSHVIFHSGPGTVMAEDQRGERHREAVLSVIHTERLSRLRQYLCKRASWLCAAEDEDRQLAQNIFHARSLLPWAPSARVEAGLYDDSPVDTSSVMRMLIPEVGEMRKASEGGIQSIGQPGGLTFDAVEVPVRWNFSLSAGGMPNNLRDLRYRPPKVGAHEPTEVGAGGAKHGPAVWREQALEGIKTSDIISTLPGDERR